MGQRFTLSEVRERTYKERDSWWTVLLVDPLASRLVLVVANRTSITPNQLSLAGFLFALGAAALLWDGSGWALVGGALCFHLSFVLDCTDGKIARLKGTGSVLGGWLDYILDRFRVLACSIGLFGGQYAASGDVGWVWLALAVVFLDTLRYLNAVQSASVYAQLKAEIVTACAAVGADPAEFSAQLRDSSSDHAVDGPTADADPSRALHQTVSRRYGWFGRLRARLRGRRIRPNLLSGVEFAMFTFIVAPVAAAVSGPTALAVVVVGSSVLLVLFELSVMYMSVLSARDFEALGTRIRSRQAPPG